MKMSQKQNDFDENKDFIFINQRFKEMKERLIKINNSYRNIYGDKWKGIKINETKQKKPF